MTKHKYPQDEALKQAQLNAIRMLGLHKHNTPLERAKALGCDLETYHGTDSPDIDAFDPSRTKITHGIFSTTSPATASHYAQEAVSKGRAGNASAQNVLPLLLRSATHKTPAYFNMQAIEKAREAGEGGVRGGEVAVTFDPSSIRSRFAAFDPARAHEVGLSYAEGGDVNPTTEQMRQELANREPMSAMGRAAAGQAGANLIKRQPQVKASEALGQAMEKGFKKTTTTQTDRTKVGGGNIGGGAFSAISEAHPDYEGKVWGVMDSGTASRLTNLTDPETAWTTMLGSATQLKTNPVVFGKLRKAFLSALKEGKMSPELEAKFNHNLALTFGEGASIRDPNIWKAIDTFDKRAAMADLMMGQGIAPKKGGIAMGGEKSGKGVIFKPTDILKGETERSLMHEEHGGDVPTFAAGPRLFSLSGTHEHRPDLHPGFPTLLHGKDLGHNVKPTPTEVYLPDWHAKFKADNPHRKEPGYYDLALGVKGEGLPSQALNDPYIRHLIREGYAEGGEVSQDEMLAHTMLHKAVGGPVQPDAPDGNSTDVGYYEGGPSDGAGMDPMQYKAAGGAIRPSGPTHIGVDEAPAMPIKLYMPPGRGDQGMPVGGVDFQPEQPGQQMMPGQPGQPPQGGQPPGGLPAPGGPAPGGPAPTPPPGGPQSNILQMTPQGQAMSAMRATPPAMPVPKPGMPRMAKGGKVELTTAQMKAALRNKKALGGQLGQISDIGFTERKL